MKSPQSLAEYMDSKGLTHRAVAKASGINESSVSKWLSHDRRFPLERMIVMWSGMRRLGCRIRFGTFCEMAAVGLEAFDAEN